jgi:hypothetical protein
MLVRMRRSNGFYPARLPLCTSAAVLLLCISACGSDNGQSRLDNNELVASYIGDERIFLQDYWGMDASHLIFLPLVALGGENFGEVQPALAERWEHSEDYRGHGRTATRLCVHDILR